MTHSEEDSDAFYDTLQLHIQKIPKKESLIAMGDLNAKIGTDHAAWTPTIGKYGLGEANSRGEKLLEFCTLHKLAICNTYFQHKDIIVGGQHGHPQMGDTEIKSTSS